MSDPFKRASVASPERPEPLVQYSISDKGVASLNANEVLRTSQVKKQLLAVAQLRKSAIQAK